MRETEKHLTCINRNNPAKNTLAIMKILKRYAKKMQAKGWIFDFDRMKAGDEFLKYGLYVSLYLPRNKEDEKSIKRWANNSLDRYLPTTLKKGK